MVLQNKNKTVKTGRTYHVTALNVFLNSMLHALISGVLIFLLLLLLFSIKVFFNLSVQVRSLHNTITETISSSSAAESFAMYNISSLNRFLVHYHETTGASYEDMLEVARNHYGEIQTRILDRDGNIVIGDPFPDNYLEIEPKKLYELVKQIGNIGFTINSETTDYAIGSIIDGDHVLLLILDDSYNFIGNSSASPEQAMAFVMRRNSYSGSNQTIAFMRNALIQSIITEDGVFDYKDKPELAAINTTYTLELEDLVYRIGIARINGNPYLAASFYDDLNRYEIFFCNYPLAEIRAALNITFTVLIIFTILLVMFGQYNFHLRQFHWLYPDNPKYSRQSTRRKAGIALTVCVLFTGVGAFFAQTLFQLSLNVLDDGSEFQVLRRQYSNRQELSKIVDSYYEMDSLAAGGILSQFIGRHPELVNKEELQTLVDMFNLQYIALFDLDGNLTMSSNDASHYSFPSDSADPAYVLNHLKLGVEQVYIPIGDDPLSHEYSIRFANGIFNSADQPDGYLMGGRYAETLSEVQRASSLSFLLQNMTLGENSSCMIVDDESHIVQYSPDAELINANAADIGFTEESLNAEYFGRITLQDNPVYMSGTQIDGNLVYIIHPETQVYLSRTPYTATVILLFIISALLVLRFLRSRRSGFKAVLYASANDEAYVLQRQKTEHAGNPEVMEEEEFEAEHKTPEFLRRLKASYHVWLYQSPEKKLFFIFTILIQLGALLLVLGFAVRSLNGEEDTLLMRIIRGRWAKSPNVFSLSANMIAALVAIIAAAAIRWGLRLVGQISDARGKTITRLLASATNYIAVIALIYVCLVNFGSDPSALVTSAGLIGVAIGIGARDLITDIIAGLFIIFEGSFKVGDIIEVAGYQGMITEIGLRTTKVIAWDHDEKIINNRSMTNVINMSARNKYSIFGFSVPYTAPTDQLGGIFEQKFRNYRAQYPEIISTPFFLPGEKKFSGMIECHVVSEINELSRAMVEHQLAADIQQILDDNGIRFMWSALPNNARHI